MPGYLLLLGSSRFLITCGNNKSIGVAIINLLISQIVITTSSVSCKEHLRTFLDTETILGP